MKLRFYSLIVNSSSVLFLTPFQMNKGYIRLYVPKTNAMRRLRNCSQKVVMAYILFRLACLLLLFAQYFEGKLALENQDRQQLTQFIIYYILTIVVVVFFFFKGNDYMYFTNQFIGTQRIFESKPNPQF